MESPGKAHKGRDRYEGRFHIGVERVEEEDSVCMVSGGPVRGLL